MKFKFLPVAAIFGLSLFGAAVAQTQVCPVGGGACVTQPTPASSYSSARAVDIMVRQPVPVLPTPADLALQIAPLLPPASGPAGIYCGRAAVYTDNMSVTERTPCQGHQVAYQAPQQTYFPPSGGFCYENGYCDPVDPGGYFTTYVFAGDCPSGYGLTTTGSSGPYQYYSCIKS